MLDAAVPGSDVNSLGQKVVIEDGEKWMDSLGDRTDWHLVVDSMGAVGKSVTEGEKNDKDDPRFDF